MKQQTHQKLRKSRDPASAGSGKTAKSKWTISGISQKTRKAVAKAARNDGVTIGDWVDETLYEAATMSLKGGTPILSLPPELLATIDEMACKLDQINSELEKEPERFRSFSKEIRTRMDEMRGRMNGTFERLHATTKAMVGVLAEQTDSAVTHSKHAAEKTLERVIDASDSTFDSIRKLRRDGSQGESKTAGS
jgi:hypothetical protein